MIETPREPIVASPHARMAFGPGAFGQLSALLDSLSMSRVLIVTTPGRAEASLRPFRDEDPARYLDILAIAVEHVPADVIHAALAQVDQHQANGIVAFGGGSAIGLAKAIALERPLPIAAIPTTYAGSEMTSIWGITEDARKRTGRDVRVAPRLVVYDPNLTVTLPPAVSAASGINAIAHAVEGVYARGVAAEIKTAALGSVGLLASSLPEIVRNPRDLPARTSAMAGAQAAGVVLELASMGLHHKICHVLGGTFGLPHALTHAVVLPHVVEFNTPPAYEVMDEVAAILGAKDAAAGLRDLNLSLGMPRNLTELGFKKADIPLAAELVTASSYPNPRQVSDQDVRKILTRASDN